MLAMRFASSQDSSNGVAMSEGGVRGRGRCIVRAKASLRMVMVMRACGDHGTFHETC